MWNKLLLLTIGLLVLVKTFFPARWKALKERVDRVVNVLLVVLGLAYAVQLLAYWLGHR